MWTAILLGAGAVMTVASTWIGLEQWGPLFLLWTGGGTHLALIVRREEREAARRELRRAA